MLERFPSTHCCLLWFCIATQEELGSSLQRPTDKHEKESSLPSCFRSCFTSPEQQKCCSFMNIAVYQQRGAQLGGSWYCVR